MPPPSTTDNPSELAPLMKTRTPESRDKFSMKARKGHRARNMARGQRPVTREYARKR